VGSNPTPSATNFDGRGLKFETLDHGGDYPDMMPQEIGVTDEAGIRASMSQ
jgi:hypothetical protein